MFSKLLSCASVLLVCHLSATQESNSTQPMANRTDPSLNKTIVFNATESPKEELMTTTASSAVEPEDEPFRHYIHYNEDYCVCDLRLNWCDIDCCCDIDCTDWDKSSFGRCIEIRKEVHDWRYCSNKNVVYINNSETRVEVTSNGIFCIVWDNTGQRQVFDEPKPISDVNRLLNMTAEHNYKWSLTDLKREAKAMESQDLRLNWKMKSGKSIWISRESNGTKVETIWELPSASVVRDGQCNAFKRVAYMNDFHSSCYRSVLNLTKDCLTNPYLNSNHYKSLNFVSKNSSNQSESNKLYIDITSTDSKSTTYDSAKKICRNAVQSVHYTVWHNGSDGVIKVEVVLQTVDLRPSTKWLKQWFEVAFLWSNRSEAIELSGNPGYIVGKPVLAAFSTKDANLSQSLTGYEMMALSDGSCDNFIKRPIEFAINSMSGCLLRVNHSIESNVCESIQRAILRILEPESALDLIGVFGNSSIETHSDWTKILNVDNTSVYTLTDDNCPILVTGVSLYIYYVMAGTAVQPQHKIVGSVKKFRTQSEVRVRCLTDWTDCDDLFIELSASVTFIDMSHPSRPDYAPPVTFKIQLPSDFFYPFLTNSRSNFRSDFLLSIIAAIIALVFDNQWSLILMSFQRFSIKSLQPD